MKLLSVNVERSKHIARVKAFVQAQRPDVLCLQELCMRDIPLMEDLMGQALTFVPMVRHPAEEDLQVVGVGMVGNRPLEHVRIEYYNGYATATPPEIAFYYEEGRMRVNTETVFNAVLMADVDGVTIGTTHFTWSPEGQTTPAQLRAAANLLDIVLPFKTKPFALCGDMNAPRGKGTFAVFAEHFMDAIPARYTTSIDGDLHRAGALELMVDAVFHTPTVVVNDVVLHTGVSDHCAVTAELTRA